MASRHTTANRQPPQHKFDPANQFRHEIEQRTAAGETCEQIASGLRSMGVAITNKTISRRRVEWGLRKRPVSKLLGKKSAVSRPKKAAGTKVADTHARKVEIEQRTQQGQSAEEIATALEAQGYVLKKGASTILRLQTQWNLIPPDPDRARGRKKKDAQLDENGNPVPKIRKRDLPKLLQEQEREANKVQRMQAQTLHYPTNCSFGPKKRVQAGAPDSMGMNGELGDDGTILIDDDGSDGVMPGLDAIGQPTLPYQTPISPSQAQAPQQVQQQRSQSVSVAAEIMSVEFLVDLATSTLSAAESLKASLLAYQERRPVPGSATGLPPSLEDLTTARRKVREAAAVMHDLAVEPPRE